MCPWPWPWHLCPWLHHCKRQLKGPTVNWRLQNGSWKVHVTTGRDVMEWNKQILFMNGHNSPTVSRWSFTQSNTLTAVNYSDQRHLTKIIKIVAQSHVNASSQWRKAKEFLWIRLSDFSHTFQHLGEILNIFSVYICRCHGPVKQMYREAPVSITNNKKSACHQSRGQPLASCR